MMCDVASINFVELLSIHFTEYGHQTMKMKNSSLNINMLRQPNSFLFLFYFIVQKCSTIKFLYWLFQWANYIKSIHNNSLVFILQLLCVLICLSFLSLSENHFHSPIANYITGSNYYWMAIRENSSYLKLMGKLFVGISF